jgi:invasion protein IalB
MKQTMMNSGMLFRVGILATLILPGLGSLAVAQATKSTAPAAKQEPARPVDAEPNSTQSNFGDWTLRCQRLSNGAETQRVCEVAQQIRAQDQQNTVAEIAIGRLKKADPLRVTVVLPVNITFSNSPNFLTEGSTGEQLDLGWRKCLPGGCIADAQLKEDLLVRWKTPMSIAILKLSPHSEA